MGLDYKNEPTFYGDTCPNCGGGRSFEKGTKCWCNICKYEWAKPVYKIKVKPLAELIAIGTDYDNWKNFPDSQGLLIVINSVPYIDEMEELLPEDRTLLMYKEFSYFGYQNPTTLDWYKFTKDMLESISEI